MIDLKLQKLLDVGNLFLMAIEFHLHLSNLLGELLVLIVDALKVLL